MTRSSRLSACIAGIALASASADALYMRPDLQKVPVARLVSNLERDLATRPKDADLHLRLARLYAMAYAGNTDELPVATAPGKTEPEVWFGHEPTLVPGGKAAPDASRSEAAKAYLRKAVEHYRRALEINPESLMARIGHGWVLERSGDRSGAIAEYRRVIERAWPKEQSVRHAGLGQRFYTQEAAEYLIPLLDPTADAAELGELRARVGALKALPRPITPIAIPLVDGITPVRIVDLDAQVPFDADGTGLRRAWTWISPDAAWLVYDPARDGRVTSALQWFGNVSFWLSWNNGYEALAALDDDRDGELRGQELRHLALWRDADSDGTADPGEVRPLADHGIAALSCRSVPGDGLLTAARSDRGVLLKNGRVRPSYDVILRPSVSVSAPAPE
jgi:tetratricopeptide (TPR) repeat protein